MGVSLNLSAADCSALECSHDRVGEEEDPDPVPPLSVLGNDLVLVADPVQVPPMDRGRVVHAKNVDASNLEVGVFKLARSRIWSGPIHA
jgi:hypothetical protein